MLRLQVICPSERKDAVLQILEGSSGVANITVVAGGGYDPPGDLIGGDLVEEAASFVIDDLRDLGLAKDGSISVQSIDAVVSNAALHAALATPGSAGDAVLWERVEENVARQAEPSYTFYLLLVIATLIASLGLLTDSLVLIVGAMIVGPEYGPLSAISLGSVERRGYLVKQGLWAIIVGFPVAIGVTAAFTAVARAADLAPPELGDLERQLTAFVSHPNLTSVWVALLAGAAGMLSILGGGSGTLIGVLVSVTTVPAAANVGIGIAYGHPAEVDGAGLQLIINLVAIVFAGVVVLAIERSGFTRHLRARRRERQNRRRRDRVPTEPRR